MKNKTANIKQEVLFYLENNDRVKKWRIRKL